jgi:hypothetical protein
MQIQAPFCEFCENELDLHQPDTMSPERLLGTCDECHAWFIIDIFSEFDGLAITRIEREVRLPTKEFSP